MWTLKSISSVDSLFHDSAQFSGLVCWVLALYASWAVRSIVFFNECTKQAGPPIDFHKMFNIFLR